MTALTLSVLLQVSAITASPQTDQYSQAYEQSAQTGQPLMILVGADWCPACMTMKTSVLPEVQRHGNLDKVAFAVVNTDRDSKLASKLMSGDGIPQLILYFRSGSGWKRMQIKGQTSAESVEAMIARGIQAAAVAKKEPSTTEVSVVGR